MDRLASGSSNYNRGDNSNNVVGNNRTSDDVTSENNVSNCDSKDNKSVSSVRSKAEVKMAEKCDADALEDALAHLGHFRLYQKYMVTMLCLPNLLAAMYSLNYVFIADQVPFRCVVPECEGLDPAGHDFLNMSIPTLLPETSCTRYKPGNDVTQSCNPGDYLNETIPCEQFTYENMDTIFAEFGLACREWQRTLVGSVRNAALPFALLLTGFVSDKYGRRTAFCIFVACAGVLGIIKALSVNYSMYLTMEFLEAALGYGFNSAGYVMMVELARPSLRAAFACATGVAYGLGGCLFALVAWRVPYWRHMLFTMHSAALILPIYWWIIDESPRWLYSKGRINETIRIIKKAARWNNLPVNQESLNLLRKSKIKDEDEEIEKPAKWSQNPWVSLVKSKVLMGRFCVCSFCWIATTFVYYGLTIASVSLSGDKYVNFALNMAMEIAASLLIMMMLERFGRKKSIFVAFLLCGIACVTPYFISHTGTGLALFFTGKLAITFAFNSLYIFSSELFPTSTRSTALAACSLVGRIGSIIAPQMPLLPLYAQAMLFGGASLLAALAALLVPETRRMRLPQSVLDAETIRKDSVAFIKPPSPIPRVISHEP